MERRLIKGLPVCISRPSSRSSWYGAIMPRAHRTESHDRMKIAVFGLGYVGTVTAGCLAANGHDVWGVDPDELKVAAVSAGHSPVVEPGLDALLAESRVVGEAPRHCAPSGCARGR